MAALLEAPDFHVGLGLGVLAGIGALVVGWGWRHRSHRPAPIGGVLLSLFVTLGWGFLARGTQSLIVGIALIGGAIAISTALFRHASIWLCAMVSAPGTWFIVSAGESVAPSWSRYLLLAGVPILGACLAATEESAHLVGLNQALIAVSVAGVVLTLPDVERALLMAGIAVMLAPLGYLKLVTLGKPGAFMTMGVFLWLVSVDGRVRPGAVVGALGCLGLLLVLPLIDRLILKAPRRTQRLNAWTLQAFALHGLVVLINSRIAGLRQSAVAASIIAVTTLILSAIVIMIAIGLPSTVTARHLNE